MIKLILSLLIAGLIASGVYYFFMLDNQDNNIPSTNQNTSQPINQAQDVVGQSQNLQNQINERAKQVQEGN